MNYDEEKRSLAKWFVMLEALLLVVFRAFDLLNIFSLAADGLKLACIVLCFLFSITLIFSMEADLDRLALMLSFFFAVVADTLLLFTDQFFFGVLAFCVVQEFQSIRIFSVRRSVVRMDGRIFSSYRSYKVRNKVLFLNRMICVRSRRISRVCCSILCVMCCWAFSGCRNSFPYCRS